MFAAAPRCAAEVHAFGTGLSDVALFTGSEIETIAGILAIDLLPAVLKARGHGKLALALAFQASSFALAPGTGTFRLALGFLLLLPDLPGARAGMITLARPFA